MRNRSGFFRTVYLLTLQFALGTGLETALSFELVFLVQEWVVPDYPSLLGELTLTHLTFLLQDCRDKIAHPFKLSDYRDSTCYQHTFSSCTHWIIERR